MNNNKVITLQLDVDDYLTEDEKKEIAENVFIDSLREGLLEKTDSLENYENYERVISNSVYTFLEDSIDSILGSSFKELLTTKVLEVLSKDITFSLFRNSSPWRKEKSVAQKMLDELVLEHRNIAEEKVKEGLKNMVLNFDEDYFANMIKEVLIEKLAK